MSDSLDGFVAVITGAAGAQGRAETALFQEKGARVVGADVSGEPPGGSTAAWERLDVTDADQWRDVVAGTVERFGRLDVLVNNAGVLQRSGVVDTEPEDWDRVLEVNAKGTWLGMRAVIPTMVRQGGGSIVNISSIDGLVGRGRAAAYHASKGAVRSLTKTAAVELAGRGVRINAVFPGVLKDRMTTIFGAIGPEASGSLEQELIGATPLGRMAEPREIAEAVAFLASGASSFMTGSEMVVDGGYTAR